MNKPYLMLNNYFEIFKKKYWNFRNEIFSKLYEELDKGIFSLEDETNNKEILYLNAFKSTFYFKGIEKLKCCKVEKYGIILKDDDEDFMILINNLKKIKIKNRDDANEIIEEWICSAHYAIFLLYYVYNLVCAFPFFEDSSSEKMKEKSVYSNESNKSNNLSEVSESLSTINNMEKFLMNNKKNEIDTQYNINTEKIFTNRFNNKNSILKFDEKYLKKLYSEKYKYLKDYNFFSYNSNFFNFFLNIFEIKKKVIHLYRNKNFFEIINIISTLDFYYNHGKKKFLYLNMNIWDCINSKRKLKKYIAYSLVSCFEKNEFDKFDSFFTNIRQYINSIKDLLKILFNELDKLNKEILIIIEDIDFINLNFFIDSYNNYNNLTFLFIYDISKEKNKENFRNCINNVNNEMFCYRFLNLDKQNDNNNWLNFPFPKNQYESLLSSNIKTFLETQSFINLFEIFNYRSFYLNEKDNFDNNFLINHLVYINLKCEYEKNKIKISRIYFKDELIKKIYFSIYNKKLLEFLNQDENTINDVFQKEDGILFEKGIIYQIMMNKMKIDFEIFEINNLYCFDTDEIFKLKKLIDKNIFFKQVSSKGEKYDCGFLIQQDENIYIKLYQITKNKYQTELNKLKRNILNLDVEYMSNQLKKIGFKKIDKFSFGIISNYDLYSKYLNKDNNSSFLELRNFCKNQKYEFLLFNFKNLNFYIENNVNQKIFFINDNNQINFSENNEILFSFNDYYKLEFLDFPFITNNLIKKSTKQLNIKNELTKFIIEDDLKSNDKNNILILGNFINNINNEINSEIIQKNSKNNFGILSYGIVNKYEEYLSLNYKNNNLNYEKKIKKEKNQKIEEVFEINNEKILEKIKDIKTLKVVVFEVDSEEKFLGKKIKNEITNLFNSFKINKNKKLE